MPVPRRLQPILNFCNRLGSVRQQHQGPAPIIPASHAASEGKPFISALGLALRMLLLMIAFSTPPALLQAEEQEIRVGMSAAFSGPTKALGIELYRGAAAYFEDVNQRGGVHGRSIQIIALDDGYNPIPAIENTIRLIESHDVFCLFNYVGTPTVTRVLPLLKVYRQRHIYLLFPFTGAQPQREFPYDELTFNLRASYRQETAGLVQNFLVGGRTRIAIFYQIDAYGRSGWDGVKRELARHNHKIIAEATYGRGTGYEASFDTQVEILKAADPQAVIAIGAYAACGGFIRDARLKGWDVPIANLSFVDSESMIDLLKASEEELGVELTHNLINSQVVPSHEDLSLAAVREYRELMQRIDPVLPTALRSAGYRPKRFSPVSFEGFLNAKMLVEILRQMGPDIDRRRLKTVIESIASFDIGIDVPVRFGPQRHQGLDAVYFTTFRDGQSVPLENGFAWSR